MTQSTTTRPKYLGSLSGDEMTAFAKSQNTPTLISLFTGCGGAALGFRQGGFEVRVMVEWMKDACETLRVNWTKEGLERHAGYSLINKKRAKDGKKRLYPRWYQKREPEILQADITKLSTEEILKAADLKVGEAFCLEGGFPCQGFSTAGARMIDDPRNQLYKECVRVIREALPRTFMLENVPGLVSIGKDDEKGSIMMQIVKDLAGCGYSVGWDILNAADYGVPQERKRVFFIGYRVDALIFPEEGKPQFHMGTCPGNMEFPVWFFERPWAKKNKAFQEMLESPLCSKRKSIPSDMYVFRSPELAVLEQATGQTISKPVQMKLF